MASVGNLETYGLFPDLKDEMLRKYALDAFAKMYGGERGKDAVMDFLGQTGTDALKGADLLRTALDKYSSNVEYAANPIAQSLNDAAKVMFADLGTRIFYTQQGSYDTHSGELATHASLIGDVSTAVADFYDDLKEHDREDDTLILIFSEFGRRIKDNGSGTDHGSGGVAFVIGGQVNGGMYGEYPSIKEEDQLEGRPPLQQRLQVHLHHHTRQVAPPRRRSHRQRPVRAVRHSSPTAETAGARDRPRTTGAATDDQPRHRTDGTPHEARGLRRVKSRARPAS